MFMKLCYLFNSIFLVSAYQSGRSCVRWLCIAPFSSVHMNDAAFVHPLAVGVTGALEEITEITGKEQQRKRSEVAERRYALVESALLRYKEEYDDMLVPCAFIVPSGDELWPVGTWGMKLGIAVTQIRRGASYKNRRQDLTSIGFEYSALKPSYGYAVVKTALMSYKKMHGDMLVPYRYIIPADDQSWPEETWGMKLGTTVCSIRSGVCFKSKQDDLTSTGFNYSSLKPSPGYSVVESALLRYKEMYGDMLVPQTFIIPANDKLWPEETWGMKLGINVRSIRSGACFKDKREELMSIGFDYSSLKTFYGYALVESALLRYKEMHGDILVPRSFIIPKDDELWPVGTWGMKLGTTVCSIKSGANYKDKRKELISVGFDFSSLKTKYGYALVKSALLRYKEIHGDMLVPQTFIISGKKSWSKETLGMKLGLTVSQIRSGACFKDKRKELMSIGFDYSSMKAECSNASLKTALLRYKKEYGDMLVPYAFVVPAKDKTWSKETRGMKLGITVIRIRCGASFKDRQDELISIGFDYSSQNSSPGYAVIKSALLRYKEMHGDMLVPTAFIIPGDNELWPQEMWGVRLGKSVCRIRCGTGHKDKRNELLRIGFDYGSRTARFSYRVVRSALLRYKKNYGDVLVPTAFFILKDDESWPEETWGMKLGHVVDSIKEGYCHQDRLEDLKSIGCDFLS